MIATMSRVSAAGLIALLLVCATAIWSGCRVVDEGDRAAVEPPGPAADESTADQPPVSPRLISLNPSLTAIVVSLGRAETLVGIDDYSARVMPELDDRPKVGGLFDPSLESVVSLRPDRVLVVAGVDQKTHAERLERLGLQVDLYPNERLDEVLENIERLGRLLGREEAAAKRIAAIRDTRAAVARATHGFAKPGAIAVVDRSPLFLVGGETFLDEMLVAVGARNLGADLAVGYPRSTTEWLIDKRPELLLDMTPGATSAADFWARWPSLPAVRSGRALTVEASRMSMPGPNLDASLRELAELVHGPAIGAAIDAEYAAILEEKARESEPSAAPGPAARSNTGQAAPPIAQPAEVEAL
jgi:iron complex transport system substrate-binding protein